MADANEPEQHKNDIYGNLEAVLDATPAIPAATVVLLRDTDAELEVLMLRKNSKIHFGGMWVFPGGRIDEADYPSSRDLEAAARRAAAREAEEEAGVLIDSNEFVWFAHWSPPPSTRKRFATWFFVTRAESHVSQVDAIRIDGGEIHDHTWIRPSAALESHRAGEIDLAPPTWVTLYHLSRHSPSATAVEHLKTRGPRVYETHVAKRSDGVRVAMWRGDAGYDTYDADAPGNRHRLLMKTGGFDFEHPTEDY